MAIELCAIHFVNAHECASPAANSIGFAKVAPVWKLNNYLLNLPSQHNFTSFLCALSYVSHLLALKITCSASQKPFEISMNKMKERKRTTAHCLNAIYTYVYNQREMLFLYLLREAILHIQTQRQAHNWSDACILRIRFAIMLPLQWTWLRKSALTHPIKWMWILC